MQRRRQQARLLFFEHLPDCAAVLARPAALMRHFVPPCHSLTIAFSQRSECPSGPERIADIADGPLHAPLLIAGPHLTGTRCEVIMRAQFQQARIELNLIAAALQHGCFEIVIKNDARLTIPCLKGMHVAAQEIFRCLVEEEFQIQGARVRQSHHKAGQRAAGAAHHHMSEVRPLGLSLLSGKHLQA
jgi:hypothetical protein